MKARQKGVLTALAVCIGFAGFFIYWYFASELPAPGQKAEQVHRRILPKAEKSTVHLYFADAENRHLTAENRALALADSPVERAKAMVHALIQGPRNGGARDSLTRTLPRATELLAVYLTEEGVAYVNFNRMITDKHPGGTLSELLSIYSVVNTLSLNIPEIKAVKILIEGREAKALAGHVDIRYTFRPNLLMIK